MLNITLKLEGLTPEQEKFLEKEYTKLEKITKKPREYHIKEAFIRYMSFKEENIKNPEIRKEFEEIEKTKPHDYYIAVALFGYIDGGY